MFIKRTIAAAVSAWLLSVLGASDIGAQARNDVRATMQGFVAAFDNLDMPAFIAFFADDATFFNRPQPPPLAVPNRVEGKKEIERVFQGVFDQIRTQSGRTSPPFQDIQPKDLLVQQFDNTAIVTFHLGTDANRGRRTFVLRRIGGEWKIEHLHASVFEVPRQ